MEVINFFVPGIPKAQPRARSFAVRGKGGNVVLSKMGQPIIRVYESGTAENWKSQIAEAAKNLIPEVPLVGAIQLRLQFLMPRPKSHYSTKGGVKDNAPYFHTSKPDFDNLSKAAVDVLTVLRFWVDDSQVAQVLVLKIYSDTPGCDIAVRLLDTMDHMVIDHEAETASLPL